MPERTVDQEAGRIAGTKVEAVFGPVAMLGKRCSCGEHPVAAVPWRTHEDGSNVVWACAAHADALMAKGLPVYEVVATCGVGGDVPCGAAATHLAIVAVRGEGLRLLSVCARHAEAFGPPLGQG
jgi:hypothetical protein